MPGASRKATPCEAIFAAPRHPYTKALIRCIPREETLPGSLTGIPGAVPSVTHYPAGCRYHPRCAHAGAICARTVPVLEHPASGGELACHFPDAEVAAMRQHLVELRNLGKRFDSRKGLFGKVRSMMAVSDVTLDIPRGKVTGVVGESGCGKSTLARLVLRLLEPSAGQHQFRRRRIWVSNPSSALRRLRRRMQMVFQDPYSAIDPRYSMADALLEPFKIQGIQPQRRQKRGRRSRPLLAMVGLGAQMASSYPHQLSGGQRQRIGIARALALEPDFLVLDEPTASLDVSIQAQIVALLEKLQADLGLTYLFISHDLGLVRYFCDRIVVMYLGRIVEILPDPKAPPRHPYTRTLLDSNFAPDPTQRREHPAPDRRNRQRLRSAAGLRLCRALPACRQQYAAASGRTSPIDSAGHAAACHHPL